MCHLVLLLPLITLPMFWLMPLPEASTAYALIMSLSVWVYFRLVQTMHQPVATGQEALLHAKGEVLRGEEGQRVLVRIASEIWQARSEESLRPGDPIEVTDIIGLQLFVKRLGP